MHGDVAGGFRVVAAEPAELADVESVEVFVAEDEADVVVRGTKSSCVEILEPAVSYQDGRFIAVLPESKPASDVCIAIAEQYEFTFQLDTSELESGSYTLVVNGVEEAFTL